VFRAPRAAPPSAPAPGLAGGSGRKPRLSSAVPADTLAPALARQTTWRRTAPRPGNSPSRPPNSPVAIAPRARRRQRPQATARLSSASASRRRPSLAPRGRQTISRRLRLAHAHFSGRLAACLRTVPLFLE
jgi:hypothetical protein